MKIFPLLEITFCTILEDEFLKMLVISKILSPITL